MNRRRLRPILFGYDRTEVDQALHLEALDNEAQMANLRQLLAAEQTLQKQLTPRLGAVEQRLKQQQALAASLERVYEQNRAIAPVVLGALQRHRQVLAEAAAARRQALQARIAELSAEAQRKIAQLEQPASQTPDLAIKVALGPNRERPGSLPRSASPADKAAPAPNRPSFSLVPGGAGEAAAAPPPPTRQVLPFRAPEPAEPEIAGNDRGDTAPPSLAGQSQNEGWRPGAVGNYTPAAAQGPASPAPPANPAPAAPPAPPANPAPAANPAVPATATAASDAVTIGIHHRVSLNLTRMLEGKVVGLDLRDNNDMLLAARGTTITPDLIARAEAAGVLSDLIVHMTWPEGGSEP